MVVAKEKAERFRTQEAEIFQVEDQTEDTGRIDSKSHALAKHLIASGHSSIKLPKACLSMFSRLPDKYRKFVKWLENSSNPNSRRDE